jgi:glutaminase
MGTAAALASPVDRYLHELVDELSAEPGGDVATYIPELGRADPDAFGIAVVTTDGHCFEAGDSRLDFTIQSISKPFVFGLALERHGREAVLSRVGVEPSGNAFNSLAVDATSRPFNPMVNGGALVTTGLVEDTGPTTRAERLVDGLSRFAGRPLGVDAAVYESERETGDRNRALAYLMRSFGLIDGDVDETLDLYFRQCSVLVDCRELAVMAATLANGGRNPVTGKKAIEADYVENVLSVMGTCGMYDFAGEWACRVGLPAKSGVSGGVIAVLPGQLGVGVYSPRVDGKGNSVRGIEACRRLAGDFTLHPLRFRPRVEAVIRRAYRGDVVRSNRARTHDADAILAVAAHRIAVYELQGDLHFASMERVFRAIVDDVEDVAHVIIDFRHVGTVDSAALEMLADLDRGLDATGVRLVLAHVDPRTPGGTAPTLLGALGAASYANLDAALEQCEDELLQEERQGAGTVVPLADQELMAGLTDDEVAAIEAASELVFARPGEVIVREGDEGDRMFFVLSGSVSVQIELEHGRRHRLSTFGAGLSFGELAMLDEGPRSADVVADDDSVLAAVAVRDVDTIGAKFPDLLTKLYRNLARNLARRLRAANAQVRSLDQ